MADAGSGIRVGLVLAGISSLVPLALGGIWAWFVADGGFSGGGGADPGAMRDAILILVASALPFGLVAVLWIFRVRQGRVPLLIRGVGWLFGLGPVLGFGVLTLMGLVDPTFTNPTMTGLAALIALPYAIGVVAAVRGGVVQEAR